MAALKDLKRGNWITTPWYGGEKTEFRIESGDLTFTTDNSGTQRRIDTSFRLARLPLVPGLLIHTVPKSGTATILVGKGLKLPSPKEGSVNLGKTLTFTFGKLAELCEATEQPQYLRLERYFINQRLYRMPHDNSVLLAERHQPPQGKHFTCYYQVLRVSESDLRRK